MVVVAAVAVAAAAAAVLRAEPVAASEAAGPSDAVAGRLRSLHSSSCPGSNKKRLSFVRRMEHRDIKRLYLLLLLRRIILLIGHDVAVAVIRSLTRLTRTVSVGRVAVHVHAHCHVHVHIHGCRAHGR